MNSLHWTRHSLVNRLQTLALLVFLGAYLALLGWLLWGSQGMVWLILMGGLFALFSPTASPQLIMRMYRARPLEPYEAPELYRVMEELARRAGLPALPVLHYLPSGMVNAFAVGTRNRAAIAVTQGLLRNLDMRELVGVLAHEMSHISNNDLRVMGLADMASRLTSILSTVGQILLLLNLPLILFSEVQINWLAVFILIFAPQISALAQLGLSRVREYNADLNAVSLTGDPEGLARALLKLERIQKSLLSRILMPGYRIPEPSLLRTHPPTEERVRRLRELQQTDGGPFMDQDMSNRGPGNLGSGNRRPPKWHIGGVWH